MVKRYITKTPRFPYVYFAMRIGKWPNS